MDGEAIEKDIMPAVFRKMRPIVGRSGCARWTLYSLIKFIMFLNFFIFPVRLGRPALSREGWWLPSGGNPVERKTGAKSALFCLPKRIFSRILAGFYLVALV